VCAHLVCSVLVIASRRTAQRHVNVACLIAHSSICANVLSEKAPLTLRPSLFAFAFRRRSASFNLDPQVVSLRLWHHTLHVSTRWQGSLVLPPCPAHSLLACRRVSLSIRFRLWRAALSLRAISSYNPLTGISSNRSPRSSSTIASSRSQLWAPSQGSGFGQCACRCHPS